jgi:hypothetical protein
LAKAKRAQKKRAIQQKKKKKNSRFGTWRPSFHGFIFLRSMGWRLANKRAVIGQNVLPSFHSKIPLY